MSADVLFSLDRIEGEQAVLIADNGEQCVVPICTLPSTPCEGKMYRRVGESFIEDSAAERARREQIRGLQNRLRRRKP